MSKDEEQALIESLELCLKEGGAPTDMWHPDYGWILLNSEITAAGLLWYQNEVKDEN